MNKALGTGLLTLIGVAAFAATPTITGVTAQQRYPWNGKVDISYTVTGDIAEEAKQKAVLTSLKVTAQDKVANTTYTATKLSGDRTLTAGTHKFVWDLDAEGLSFKSSNVVFKVSCETTPALYCVIDLSAGANATSYPVTYLAAPPSGGFNVDAYKLTKLVLRRVAKGSNSAGGSMSKDMWVGIFEVTQKQWLLVMGSYPSGSYGTGGTANATNDRYPIEGVTLLYGDDTSFLSKVSSKSGVTNMRRASASEWEYACRGGTTTDLNNGTSLSLANANKVAWWGKSVSGATSYNNWRPTIVGSYAPNNWGLYDMHGNVSEGTSHYEYMVGGGYYCFHGGNYGSSLDEIKPTAFQRGMSGGFRVFAEAK